MKYTLERIFSEENLLSYGKACTDVAYNLSIRHFDTLLIPSRGAFPIFLGAIKALNYLSEIFDDHGEIDGFKDIYHRLSPTIPVNGWLNKYLPKENRVKEDERRINILLAPFTADLNLKNGKINELDIIKQVRGYWSNVTRSFFLSKEERRENIYFKSYVDTILRFIEGRNELAISYENFPKAKSSVIIDTVISGRASSTILNYMDGLGIDPYSILVVDSNGEKLKSPFKIDLERRQYSGEGSKVRFVYTNRIVSEDEGAALEGIIALVYPSVMIRSLDLKEKKFLFGAGSWYYPSAGDEIYSQNFDLFMKTINDAIAINVFNNIDGKKHTAYYEKFEKSRNCFLDNMDRYNFLGLKDDSVEVFKLNEELIVDRPYETSSHVLHAPFNKESTEKVMEHLVVTCFNMEYNPDKIY